MEYRTCCWMRTKYDMIVVMTVLYRFLHRQQYASSCLADSLTWMVMQVLFTNTIMVFVWCLLVFLLLQSVSLWQEILVILFASHCQLPNWIFTQFCFLLMSLDPFNTWKQLKIFATDNAESLPLCTIRYLQKCFVESHYRNSYNFSLCVHGGYPSLRHVAVYWAIY